MKVEKTLLTLLRATKKIEVDDCEHRKILNMIKQCCAENSPCHRGKLCSILEESIILVKPCTKYSHHTLAYGGSWIPQVQLPRELSYSIWSSV